MKNPNPSSFSKPSSAGNSRWESAPHAPSTPQDTKPSKPSNPKESDKKDVPSSSSAPAPAPAPAAGGGPGGPPLLTSPGGGGGSPSHAPTQPIYGFQNLERRTIVLADGTVRSYFALHPDYPIETFGHGGRPEPGLGFGFDRFSPDRFREPPPRYFCPPRDFGPPRDFSPSRDYWLDGLRRPPESGPSTMKRKYPEDDEFAWHRPHISQYGNPNPSLNPILDWSPMRTRYDDDLRASKQVKLDGVGGYRELPVRSGRGAEDLAPAGPVVIDVDQQALKRAFLKFAKTINENAGQRKNYLEDGKNGPLQCIVCGSVKTFEDSKKSHGQKVEHLKATKPKPTTCSLKTNPHEASQPNLKQDHEPIEKRDAGSKKMRRDKIVNHSNKKQDKACFNCGKPGHIFRFCHQKKFEKNSAKQKETEELQLEAENKGEEQSCTPIPARASKEFSDVHGLIMHSYSSQDPDLRIDHLGLHKAVCVLMGWNYAKAPENSKAYQSLSADDASTNREDLIMWPPTVIIHNTNSGRRKNGRMEGMGNKEMDIKLKDLGFGGGKSKSVYGKEGHLGITVVKFGNTQAGLKEAECLAEYFEKDNHGRKGWERAQASQSGGDEKNPTLVKLGPKSGETKMILYGYLTTTSDLEKIDFDTRKRATIKSRRELDLSE